MANGLYDAGRNAFLTGDIDWVNDTIATYLLDSDYTPDLVNDDFLDDVDAGALVDSQNLSSKTASAGIADAADNTHNSVSNGTDITQILIYKNTGTPSTSNLIGLIDTASGLPVTPNGGDITIVWDSGANKIFKL